MREEGIKRQKKKGNGIGELGNRRNVEVKKRNIW